MAMRRDVPISQRRADYAKGEYRLDTSDYVLSPQAMVEYLRETLTASSYQPPLLPSVAIELMRLTRQPQVHLSDVRQVLERDTLLAAKVLQLAQSALYSRGSPIRSLDEAISRLGLRTLEELFLQTVLSMRVFRASGYEAPMAELMRHSMLTAHVARNACRLTSIPDEFAFMCGLLHDVGMAAGLILFSERLAAGKGTPPRFEELSLALQVVHEEASAILAQAWELHPEVRVVLGIHHQTKIGNRVHPMAAILCVSDWIAAEAGAGIGTESEQQRAEAAAQHLGFSTSVLDGLRARAEEVLALAL
jgi:HD-like signal output (HDOD) protein